jgi:hypothetical protein
MRLWTDKVLETLILTLCLARLLPRQQHADFQLALPAELSEAVSVKEGSAVQSAQQFQQQFCSLAASFPAILLLFG